MSEPLHIVPENDFRVHDLSVDCWCKPVLTDGLDNCYTHNSADGREFLEDLILTKAEIYLHIARVAALWFADTVTFFTNCNDDSDRVVVQTQGISRAFRYGRRFTGYGF